jgi:hypothetical protein
MYKKSNGTIGFSWSRLINNSVPNSANDSTPQYATIVPQGQGVANSSPSGQAVVNQKPSLIRHVRLPSCSRKDPELPMIYQDAVFKMQLESVNPSVLDQNAIILTKIVGNY